MRPIDETDQAALITWYTYPRLRIDRTAASLRLWTKREAARCGGVEEREEHKVLLVGSFWPP